MDEPNIIALLRTSAREQWISFSCIVATVKRESHVDAMVLDLLTVGCSDQAACGRLPNRMASIFKVVAVCAQWSVFRVVVRLGVDLGQQPTDCQLSWAIMF